jgi:TPR repeat protein
VKLDYKEAAKWYRQAADQGNAGAQNALGELYEAGQGVLRDQAEAAKWYRRAAEQGHAAGQYGLAVMYLMGNGVLKDDAEALSGIVRPPTRVTRGNLSFGYALQKRTRRPSGPAEA